MFPVKRSLNNFRQEKWLSAEAMIGEEPDKHQG